MFTADPAGGNSLYPRNSNGTSRKGLNTTILSCNSRLRPIFYQLMKSPSHTELLRPADGLGSTAFGSLHSIEDSKELEHYS
ncbi:hypothetical protein MJO29_016710 [Puccinia striiformis f. sp. tritici]|nr:hypothetical protein MJO29_016710 [Puccinia striiformis f. sp. tritici]